MEVKLLKNEEVLRVQVLPGKFDYAKGTKMEGKQYQRFAFGGKVFISNDDSFAEELKAGNVAEVEIGVNDEGNYSLNAWVSWTAKNNLKRKMVENESITVANYKPTTVKEYAELG